VPAPPPTVSARQLNRATLQRQLLLRRERLGVVDGVRRVIALQAQEPASPYLALWNRLIDFDAGDLDAAYLDHAVVKASLMRITLHAVVADDHPAFHQAMTPVLRASRLHDRRFQEAAMTVAEADALVGDLLDFTADPRTKDEIERWLEGRLGRPVPRAWWALRTYAPLVHVATGGPWSHQSAAAYLRAPTGTPAGHRPEAVAHLLRRYLAGFGPATSQDFGQFTMLRQPDIQAALGALGDELVTVEGPGRTLYDMAGAAVPDEESPAPPRLLAMWDSCLLAYADRRRLIPDEYRPLVIRRNGDVLATVLVDGYVAGAWRAVDGAIEVATFASLTDEAWGGIEAEAVALRSFLADRDPQVYRRYGRWWDTLPKAVTRRL
jgi:hypothetical protein